MDPLTQGALGAAAAISLAPSRDLRRALVVGFLAGMAPDLDVLIRSSSDPLLALEHHRGFTHSLAFIPVGGTLVAAAIAGLDRLARRPTRPFAETAAYATIGWATHGLLDACTSYGTSLLWPFSSARIAWENISIIDPVITLPLLVGVAAAARLGRRGLARGGLLVALAWLAFGVVQRERAQELQAWLAAERGHTPTHATVKPGFANLVAWRSIYVAESRYFIDGLRPGLGGPPRVYEGATVDRLVPGDFDAILGPDSVARRDIDRFTHFSAGYLGRHPTDPTLVGDMRYAMVPDGIQPLWGLRVVPGRPTDLHLDFAQVQARPSDAAKDRFVDMLLGRGGRVIFPR